MFCSVAAAYFARNQMNLTYLKVWCYLSFWKVTQQPSEDTLGTWICLMGARILPAGLPEFRGVDWSDEIAQQALWDWLIRGIDDAPHIKLPSGLVPPET